MQKITFIFIIALLGIGYSRAQFVLQPDEDDLKPREIPSGQNINRSQLIGTDWRRIKPYYDWKWEELLESVGFVKK